MRWPPRSGWATPSRTRRTTSRASTPRTSCGFWRRWRSTWTCPRRTSTARASRSLGERDFRVRARARLRDQAAGDRAQGRRAGAAARAPRARAGRPAARERRWRAERRRDRGRPDGPRALPGPGAGSLPTTSAVVADALDAAVSISNRVYWPHSFRREAGLRRHADGRRAQRATISGSAWPTSRACLRASPACWASARSASPR